MKGNRASVLVAVKDVSLEVNAKKLKCVFLSCELTRHISIAHKKASRNVAVLNVGRPTLTNQNHMKEELRAEFYVHMTMHCNEFL
jgi:hypothetical protein